MIFTEEERGLIIKSIEDVDNIGFLTEEEQGDVVEQVLETIEICNMGSYERQVERFHEAFGHTVNEVPTEISIEDRKLRINLIFEELKELAEGLGVAEHFALLCQNNVEPSSSPRSNMLQLDTLDALCDLQYVLSGTVVSCGFTSKFNKAFAEVHRSNMSKLCSNMKDVIASEEHYQKLGVNTIRKQIDTDNIAIIRVDDGKILKNVNYSKADLAKFVS